MLSPIGAWIDALHGIAGGARRQIAPQPLRPQSNPPDLNGVAKLPAALRMR